MRATANSELLDTDWDELAAYWCPGELRKPCLPKVPHCDCYNLLRTLNKNLGSLRTMMPTKLNNKGLCVHCNHEPFYTEAVPEGKRRKRKQYTFSKNVTRAPRKQSNYVPPKKRDDAEIKRLRERGLSYRAIAKLTGVHHKTVMISLREPHDRR